jgi:hypothetical protein
MSHIDGTMEYRLKHPVKYSKDGNFVEAEYLEFSEYSGPHRKEYFRLRQTITAVIMAVEKIAEGRKKDDDATPQKPLADQSEEEHGASADDLATVVGLGFSLDSGVDIDAFVETFKAMVCNSKKPLCKMDGAINMRAETWDDMHPDDQFDAAVKYCCFFGIGLAGARANGQNTSTTRPMQVKAL